MYMENTIKQTTNQSPQIAKARSEPRGYYDAFKTGTLVSSLDTLKKSWGTYKKNWGKYFVLTILIYASVLVPMIIMGILTFTSIFLPAIGRLKEIAGQGLGAFPASALITVSIFGLILIPIIILASMFFQFALTNQVIHAEENLDTKSILKLTWSKFCSLLWVTILQGLIVVVGLTLFIIPGIILAFYFSFSFYVVLAEDKHGYSALKRSAEIIRGYGWALLRRWTVWMYLAVALTLISLIPILGWFIQAFLQFIIMPLALIYYFSIYVNFSDRKINGKNSDELTLSHKLVTVLLITLPLIIMIFLSALGFAFSLNKKSDNSDHRIPKMIEQYKQEYLGGEI